MQRNELKQCNVQQIMENMPVLRDLPVGSHVGLALNSNRGLHLYVDGSDQGVIGTDVPDPCCFMFDLCGYCTTVLCCLCSVKQVLHHPFCPPLCSPSLCSPPLYSPPLCSSTLCSPPLCSPPLCSPRPLKCRDGVDLPLLTSDGHLY